MDRTTLPIPPAAFTGRVGFSYADLTAEAIPPVHAPAGAPNVVLILGTPVASARIPETVHFAFSFEERFDIGQDSASPVGAYESPFPFAGTIQRIDLDIGDVRP